MIDTAVFEIAKSQKAKMLNVNRSAERRIVLGRTKFLAIFTVLKLYGSLNTIIKLL